MRKFKIGDIVICNGYNRCFHKGDVVVITNLDYNYKEYNVKVLKNTDKSECRVGMNTWTIAYCDENCWDLVE